MRWLALLLVAANGALFLWLSSSGGDNVRSVQEGKLPRVAEIQLIDEQAGNQVESPGPSGQSRPVVQAGSVSVNESRDFDDVDAPGPDVADSDPDSAVEACFGIGWFDERSDARAYRSELREEAPSLDFLGIRERSEPLEPFHWVIIPPLPSRDEAMTRHRELVEAGIEAYVVPSGERENAISLGLFRSRQSAEQVLRQRQAENIDARLVKFPRNRISYALVFQGVAEPAIPDPDTASGRSDGELQLIEFSACEGVATTEKNP